MLERWTEFVKALIYIIYVLFIVDSHYLIYNLHYLPYRLPNNHKSYWWFGLWSSFVPVI